LKDADSKDQNHFAGAPSGVSPEIKEVNSKTPIQFKQIFWTNFKTFPGNLEFKKKDRTRQNNVLKWAKNIRILSSHHVGRLIWSHNSQFVTLKKLHMDLKYFFNFH
jgi:hypothetical protein